MAFPQNLVVRIEKSCLKEYEDLQKKKNSPFFEQRRWVIFLTAMLFGYYNNKTRSPLQSPSHDLFQAAFLGPNEEWLIKSLVIADTESLLCITDNKEIIKIAEEYANGGIGILFDTIFGSGDTDSVKIMDIIAKREITNYYQLISEENPQTVNIHFNWKDIILKGENDIVEFKSSMRWDYKLNRVNTDLEYVIAKSISAFLNSRGGKLFIGIDDDGNTLGLQNDFKTLGKKQNKDGFSLKLQEVINKCLGKEIHHFLKIQIDDIDKKEICIITISPCDKPVYVKKDNSDEFFIRAGTASQPMSMKEAHDYIVSHWKKE